MNSSLPTSTAAANPPSSVSKPRVTGAYYLTFSLLGVSIAAFGPSLPYLAEHTRSRLGEISFLFVARSLGYLLGAFLVGRIFDRRRGHRVLAAGMLLMAAALVLVPAVPLLAVLTAVLFVLGFAESFLDVGGNTLLVWLYGERVGPFMNGLHFFYGVGAFLAPILIAQSVQWSGDIRWAYWGLALMIIPAGAALLRLPSPAHPAQSGDGSLRPANGYLVGLLVLFFFLFVGAEASFGNWVYTYTLQTGLEDATSAAYLNSAFWGALMVGRLIAIPLSTRFKPHQLLFADLAGSIAGVALIVIWPGSRAALWAGAMLTGVSMASLFPLSLSLAGEWMTITGQINRWFFFGANVGAMISPWLIGQMIEPLGPRSAMLTILIGMSASLAVFVWVSKQAIGRELRVATRE